MAAEDEARGYQLAVSDLHWMRKHMGDVARVAKRCAGTETLTPAQRQALDRALDLAHEMAIDICSCSYDNACAAVSALCSACLTGLPGEPAQQCQGRTSWETPCDLIRRQHWGQ